MIVWVEAGVGGSLWGTWGAESGRRDGGEGEDCCDQGYLLAKETGKRRVNLEA